MVAGVVRGCFRTVLIFAFVWTFLGNRHPIASRTHSGNVSAGKLVSGADSLVAESAATLTTELLRALGLKPHKWLHRLEERKKPIQDKPGPVLLALSWRTLSPFLSYFPGLNYDCIIAMFWPESPKASGLNHSTYRTGLVLAVMSLSAWIWTPRRSSLR